MTSSPARAPGPDTALDQDMSTRVSAEVSATNPPTLDNPGTDQSSATLTLSGVHMHYGAQAALSDISFSIKAGTISTMIGANGAGKSSLVRAICGRHPLTSGSVLIAGKNATERAARRHLGVAPQNAALYPALTARENLFSFARQSGMPARDARTRIEPVLSLIGMGEHGDKPVRTLSGGMRQRINIGAAIMHQPQLVILDEPVSSLDPDGTAQTNRLICRLREEGFGVLLITHDMDQAMTLTDQLVVLSGGYIVALGKPQDIVDIFCGTRINLFLTTPDTALADRFGFRLCPDRLGCWRKSVLDRAALSAEIPRLIEAGIAVDRLNIVPSHLGDVLSVLAKTGQPGGTP
ncbi:MAG: ABC transporter ATP-binding protein [Pseudomonadota bacterium]